MFERLKYLFILLSVCTFSSCNSIMDDGACIEGDGMLRKVTFTLTVDDAQRQTKAAWEDGYTAEEAMPYDNRIAYGGLRVLFFSEANAYLGEVKSLMHWPVSETEYRFAGDVTDLNLKEGTNYKIMVLANCPNHVDNIGDLYFELGNAAYPDGYIPMWGVKMFIVSGEELQDAGTISLLRSMAKIEVVLSNEMIANGYTLDNVMLNHHNARGYCLPTGWNSVAHTTALDQESCLRAYHLHIADPLALYEQVNSQSFCLYVPEYNVLHTATHRPNLSVTLGDGTSPLEFPNSLRFGSYDANGDFIDGSEANIVRNHIYRFNIVGIASGLEIDYEVMDWDYDEEENLWQRGEFAYPTYHNPVVPDYTNPSATITAVPQMRYNNGANPEEDAFTVWFKMDRPAGQLWTPVHNQAMSDYEIRVYRSDAPTVQLTDPDTWVADSEHWYKIVLIPLNPANSGTTVNFGITYTQDWMPTGSSLYLFINGKVDDIAWPESGNDPKIIEVKQL